MNLGTFDTSKKYKKVIFLDSENTGERGIEFVSSLTEDDLLIIFYSSKSFRLHLSRLETILNSSATVTTYEVNCNTQNAMDFCIISELSYLLAKEQSEQYIIVSNDKGYTPIVHNWRHRHFDVRLWGRPEILLYSPNSVIIQSENADKAVENGKAREKEEATKAKEQLAKERLKEKIEKETSKQDNKTVTTSETVNEKIETEKGISNEDYNKMWLANKVNIFGASKEKQIVKVITSNEKFEDAESKLKLLIKRNQDKYIKEIKDNWNLFRHDKEDTKA